MKRSDDVQAPLGERPRTGEGAQVLGWLVERVRELLALLAFSGIELGVLLHVRPPVTLADSSVGKRPTSYMTATDPFVNLVEEILDFAGVNALKVGPVNDFL